MKIIIISSLLSCDNISWATEKSLWFEIYVQIFIWKTQIGLSLAPPQYVCLSVNRTLRRGCVKYFSYFINIKYLPNWECERKGRESFPVHISPISNKEEHKHKHIWKLSSASFCSLHILHFRQKQSSRQLIASLQSSESKHQTHRIKFHNSI